MTTWAIALGACVVWGLVVEAMDWEDGMGWYPLGMLVLASLLCGGGSWKCAGLGLGLPLMPTWVVLSGLGLVVVGVMTAIDRQQCKRRLANRQGDRDEA